MLRDWRGLPLGMLPAHHIKIYRYRALRARLLLEEKEPGLSNSNFATKQLGAILLDKQAGSMHPCAPCVSQGS